MSLVFASVISDSVIEADINSEALGFYDRASYEERRSIRCNN